MRNEYVVAWESNGGSTFGTLGKYTNVKRAIIDGREVVVGNQMLGSPSGRFSVRRMMEDGEFVSVFCETVYIGDRGSTVLRRSRDAEGVIGR